MTAALFGRAMSSFDLRQNCANLKHESVTSREKKTIKFTTLWFQWANASQFPRLFSETADVVVFYNIHNLLEH
jgi:meiotically up-regulated gene 157 (Mug157) protein